MANTIAWVCLVAGGLVFVLAVVELVRSWGVRGELAAATKQAAQLAASATSSEEELEKHAGIDLKGQWEGLAALAAALKDLDKSSRLFVISLAFAGISAGIVGLDMVATGITQT